MDKSALKETYHMPKFPHSPATPTLFLTMDDAIPLSPTMTTCQPELTIQEEAQSLANCVPPLLSDEHEPEDSNTADGRCTSGQV